jgi:hypothetical protein
MPDNAAHLLELAHKTFCDLSPGEREVLRCAAIGENADLAQWGPPPTEGKKRKPGGGPLRSTVVEWLCTNVRAMRLVHRKGVCIAHATLDTKLDLQSAHVPFFFGLHACRLPSLDANGAHFGVNLYLKHCHLDGRLDIHSTCISGQLLCNGALVLETDGVSIRADGAEIGHGVILSDGFRSVGEVSLAGATINGQLICTGGRFLNPSKIAISADGVTVGGQVIFTSRTRANENAIPFLAVGEVRLLGAKILGQLDCTGGRFLNRNGKALSADNADIGNDVLLPNGFRAMGEVRLMSAKIRGQLDCEGGTFLNPERMALVLQGASVDDAMFLEPKRISGEVCLRNAMVKMSLRMQSKSVAQATLDLRNAKVSELYDNQESWPGPGKLHLDGFVYDDIDHDSPRSAADRLEWLRRMPNRQFLPQPYEQLAKWFQKTGHDSEAKAVRIAKEWSRFKSFGNPFKMLWWLLKFIFVGFGHKPHYAAYWLIGLIVLGSYVYNKSIDLMTPSVSYNFNATEPAEGNAGLQASDYPDLNTLLYSTDVALPIVDLQQERYWMPNSSKPEGRFLWWFNWFEVLFGWFLASMGIAGATGIIRKD